MNTPDRNYTSGQIGWDFTHDGVGSNFPAVKLTVSNSAYGLSIDNNGNLSSIYIDQDSDSTSDIYAVTIVNDNAGTGAPGGIDFSNFAQGEPLLKVPASGTAPAGTVSGKVAVAVSGTSTLYYLTYHLAA